MSNPIPGVSYTRIHPSLDWVASGRPALVAPPPPPPSTDIVLGETKPTSALVGAGLIRPAPTRVADGSDGTWSNGVLTITKDLRDCIVNGTVRVTSGAPVIENCDIRGNSAFPPSGMNMVNCTSADAKQTLIRYCTIRSTFSTPNFNGIGGRNYIAEFNDISHVTDGFSPSVAGDLDAKTIIRGNYVHDHMFYAPDPAHSATPPTAADGTVITGPWAGQGWNHADSMQLQQPGITGITLIGNFFDARWANDAVSTLPLPNARKELAALMLNAGADLTIDDNWFDGGEYCVNNGNAAVTGSMRRNRFGPNIMFGTNGLPFALMLSAPGLLTFDDTPDQNVWEDTGLIVRRRGS